MEPSDFHIAKQFLTNLLRRRNVTENVILFEYVHVLSFCVVFRMPSTVDPVS